MQYRADGHQHRHPKLHGDLRLVHCKVLHLPARSQAESGQQLQSCAVKHQRGNPLVRGFELDKGAAEQHQPTARRGRSSQTRERIVDAATTVMRPWSRPVHHQGDRRHGRILRSHLDPDAAAALLLGACFQRGFLLSYAGDTESRAARRRFARRLVTTLLANQ